MPVRVTLSSVIPNTPPAEGWQVRYRIKGSSDAYTTAIGSPFTALPIVFDTTDPAGTLYEGYIKSDCGTTESVDFAWVTPCACPDTYVVSAGGAGCEKVESIPATVTNSGYCLTASVNGVYGSEEMRVYNLSFVNSDFLLPGGSTGGHIVGRSTATPQWANPLSSLSVGPLNREGVWIDSDCDGNKNSLSTGTVATIAFIYNNLGPAKIMYIGCGADNRFKVIVNDTEVADSGTAGGTQFRIWHVIPVNVIPGINRFNVKGIGDGTINDSIGAVLYDNTSAEILAAVSDAALNIIFKTSSLRTHTFDVADCPTGYTMDTSGGSGSYTCKRTLTDICNGLP